jgi:endonuclease/exonuclease/phosphatase family metal-dependent hydrolase
MRTEPLRVLTFNILGDWDDRAEATWEGREAAVLHAISQASPDLAGLQEVTDRQRRVLDAKLPDLRRIPLEAHDGGAAPGPDDPLNTILYRPSRLRFAEGGIFWLSMDPTRPARDWEAAFPRCAAWARLVDRATGTPVLFISTHLDNESERARAEGVEQILKFLRTPRRDGRETDPAIIVGDFNSDASLDIHRRLTEGPPSFLDAWEETHGGAGVPYADGTFHDFTGKALAEVGRIDWILFNRPLRPIKADLVDSGRDGRFPSDHFPVSATFHLP